MTNAVTVHAVLRNRARVRGAERWIDELPDRIAALESTWSLQAGPPYESATEAYVAPATLADGTAAVLKILLPWPGGPVNHEPTVLRLAGGNGLVGLLHDDETHEALLLEALGPSLDQLGLPMPRRHEIMCDTLTQFWHGVRGRAGDVVALGLPSGAQKAAWLADHITELAATLEGACTSAAIDHALACADRRRRAHDPRRATLVHGDVHQWNTLQHPDGGYRFVDPDGLHAEAEYDLGILMREDPDEPDDPARDDPRRRARWLADRVAE